MRRPAVIIIAIVGALAVAAVLFLVVLPGTPSSVPPSSSPSGSVPDRARPTDVVQVTDFGARPDDDGDDTAAIQKALDALKPGQELLFAPGIYRHQAVLNSTVAGVWLSGPGATLLATSERESAFQVAADDVTVDALTFAIVPTTARIPGRQRSKLWILGHRGALLQNVVVTGSAAAGIVMDGAADFRIEHATVSGTRADGIHMTNGAHDGVVNSPTVSANGDDGVSVVSYMKDAEPCARITINSPHVFAQYRGRGISVVGGEDITYNDIDIENSNAAGVYVAVEGDPFNTRPVSNVTVRGGRLVGTNTNTGVDHGAVLVFLGTADARISGVKIENLTIQDTRPSASANVEVKSKAGQKPTDLQFSGLQIEGGPSKQYGGNVPATTYSTS